MQWNEGCVLRCICRINWKGSSRLFGTFVKNLFLGPFTVARVSARVEEIHHRALTPSSDADTAECRADNSGDQLKGRRSWWPTAFALACFFYGSIACQVRLEFFLKTKKNSWFLTLISPKFEAFLIQRIFPLKSANRRRRSLRFIMIRKFFSNSFQQMKYTFVPIHRSLASSIRHFQHWGWSCILVIPFMWPRSGIRWE